LGKFQKLYFLREAINQNRISLENFFSLKCTVNLKKSFVVANFNDVTCKPAMGQRYNHLEQHNEYGTVFISSVILYTFSSTDSKVRAINNLTRQQRKIRQRK